MTGDGIGGRPPAAAAAPRPAESSPHLTAAGRSGSASPCSGDDDLVTADEAMPEGGAWNGGLTVMEEEEDEEGSGEQVEPSSSRRKRPKM